MITFKADWKIRRNNLTLFYGYLTFIITVIFILILPLWNKLSNYIYYKSLKFNKWLKLNPKNTFLKINPYSAQMIIFWSIVLTLLSTLQTQWDLRFLAARLGRVPVYCLPTILFLTLRPSPLSDVLYLQLLPIHKWLSRLVILQSLLHTLIYLFLMVKTDTLNKLSRVDNMNGVVAMLAFLIIIVTSLPYIRRMFYNIFFINHYICTWIVTITLYFHVRPSIPYLTILNISILLYQIYYKFKISKLSQIKTYKISNQMVIADLPNDSISLKYNLPGCHIRLIDFNYSRFNLINYLRLLFIPIQHPYTLSTLSVDNSQKLIIRLGKYKFDNNKKYLITGSYLPHLSFIKKMPTLNNQPNMASLLVKTIVKKCLIVVGGSAISFALPILRVLNYNGSMVKIIWVIRDHEDLKALDYFKNYLINDDCIDIFITGQYTMREKKNFKDALSELHSKKIKLQLQQETEILSGGYSYYNEDPNFNSNINNTNQSIPKDKVINNDQASLISSNSLDNINTQLNSENSTEISPLNNTDSLNQVSYGSNYRNDLFQNSMHRKSYIDFRSHNNTHTTSNSYKDETIDIELNENENYRKNYRYLVGNIPSPLNTATPSAGIGFHSNSKNSHSYNLNENENESGNKTKNQNNNKSFPSTFSSNKKNTSSKYTTNTDITQISPIKQLCDSLSASSSSALYDDLENYWILKDSFCKIEFGRPKLGLYYYSWCIGSSCIGPIVSLKTGKSVCYNDQSAQNEELYSNDVFLANRRARLKERNGKPDDMIWVIGAGPSGLVDNVRLWANDCGFCFHEESFIV